MKPDHDKQPETADTQVFHDRAKDAGDRLAAYVLSISAGATGLFFVSLTTHALVASLMETILLSTAMLLYAATVLMGLWQLHVNARRYYEIARQKESSNPKWDRNEKLKRLRLRLIFSSYATVSLGLIVTVAYLLLRISG